MNVGTDFDIDDRIAMLYNYVYRISQGFISDHAYRKDSSEVLMLSSCYLHLCMDEYVIQSVFVITTLNESTVCYCIKT